MSHTTTFESGGCEYTLIHNSDWSGDVTIIEEAGTGELPHTKTEYKIPGAVLLFLGREAARKELIDKLIGVLEQM